MDFGIAKMHKIVKNAIMCNGIFKILTIRDGRRSVEAKPFYIHQLHKADDDAVKWMKNGNNSIHEMEWKIIRP